MLTKHVKLVIVGDLIFVVLFAIESAQGAIVEYDLTIAQKEVCISGQPATGMGMNGQIPGPILQFTEGDTARVHIHNTMDVDTSIHWHGILVPPDMDGVPCIFETS